MFSSVHQTAVGSGGVKLWRRRGGILEGAPQWRPTEHQAQQLARFFCLLIVVRMCFLSSSPVGLNNKMRNDVATLLQLDLSKDVKDVQGV
ncbi:hypothetical protein ACP70R_037949 [Stipagrostis hirtigluma subsp. patula]